ncbi:MAG: hypothetical protein JKY52_00040 [Flavobacteriales bacterium]|nr:hypothetical protein [Flavobacteriales bacterium]
MEARDKLTGPESEYIEQCCHELFDSLTECFGVSFDGGYRDKTGNALYNAIAEFYLANKPPKDES